MSRLCIHILEEKKSIRKKKEFNKELFIEAVRAHACIWDVNASSYKDRGTKQNAWNSLGKIFGQEW